MGATDIESRVSREEQHSAEKCELKATKREPKSSSSGVDRGALGSRVSSCETWGSHSIPRGS